jgi:glycine cleavage system regulatory protein
MAHLGGKFAGILHIVVPEERTEALLAALEALATHGLSVNAERDTVTDIHKTFRPFTLELLGNDRPGIVREISHALASRGVNVEEFRTECVDAPMSGGQLFRATAQLRLPPNLLVDDLRHQLEQVAHDLMVDISLNEPA